jgi:hypothetical protein
VAWSREASAALSDLRSALDLAPPERHSVIHDVASRLDLPHLVTFVERVGLRSA